MTKLIDDLGTITVQISRVKNIRHVSLNDTSSHDKNLPSKPIFEKQLKGFSLSHVTRYIFYLIDRQASSDVLQNTVLALLNQLCPVVRYIVSLSILRILRMQSSNSSTVLGVSPL